MQNVKYIFSALLTLVMIAGCGASVESYGEGGKVLKWMKVSTSKIDSLRASATLLQKSPKGTFRGDAYVFFKAPSSLRIDVLGPVNNLVGIFVSREGRGLVVDYMNGVGIYSNDSSCLFSEFLGTDVVLPEFSAIFMGQPPVIQFDESELRWTKKGYYILDLKDTRSGVVEKMQLTQGLFGTVVIRAVVIKDNKKMVDMGFRKRGWKSDISPLMPRIIEVGFVQEKMQLLFKYKKVEINAEIPNNIFDVQAPPDFAIESMQCKVK